MSFETYTYNTSSSTVTDILNLINRHDGNDIKTDTIKDKIFNKLKILNDSNIPLYTYAYNDTFLSFISTKKINDILYNSINNYKLRENLSSMDYKLIHGYMREYGIISIPLGNGQSYYKIISSNTRLKDLTEVVIFLKHNYTSRLDHLVELLPPQEIQIQCLTYEDNKYKIVKKSSNEIRNLSKIINSYSRFDDIVKHLVNVKLISIKGSSELFGYKRLKQEMLDSGSTFKISEFHNQFKCKKDEQIRTIIEIPKDGRSYKFLADEVEFLLPDFSVIIKGYNEPKNRIINDGDQVKIVDDKHIKLSKGTIVTVKTVFKEGNKVFITTVVNNKKYLINIKKVKKV